MNEQEMRDRIKEIDKIRNDLAKEKRKYEDKLHGVNQQFIFESNKKFEGKCFITQGLVQNKTKYIKAFKILKVLDPHHHNYAECIVIVDGIEKNCWNVQAIKLETLPIWCPNTNKFINNPVTDPNMIDMYKEIDEKEFMDLYKKYMKKLNYLAEVGEI